MSGLPPEERDEIHAEDDEIVAEDGEIVPEDDEIVPEDDEIVPALPEIVPADGEIVAEDDEILAEDDEFVAEDGEIVPGDGEIVAEDDETVAEDGAIETGPAATERERMEIVVEGAEAVADHGEVVPAPPVTWQGFCPSACAMLPLPPLVPISALIALSLFPPFAHARLGESEEQSKARYGEPAEGLVGPNDKPLIAGSRELAYNFQGWRIRAAFVNGVTHKIEYVKIPEGGQPKPLTEAEVQALLDAEKGTFSWRERKPRTGFEALNQLQQTLAGMTWERSDHADAKLLMKLLFVAQSRDAEKLEKDLAKKAGKATPIPAAVPKF